MYNEFCFDFDKPPCMQTECLTEDLLQVSYGEYTLDIGWYPEYDESGRIIVLIVRHYLWDAPIYKKSVSSEFELLESIDEAKSIINQNHQ